MSVPSFISQSSSRRYVELMLTVDGLLLCAFADAEKEPDYGAVLVWSAQLMGEHNGQAATGMDETKEEEQQPSREEAAAKAEDEMVVEGTGEEEEGGRARGRGAEFCSTNMEREMTESFMKASADNATVQVRAVVAPRKSCGAHDGSSDLAALVSVYVVSRRARRRRGRYWACPSRWSGRRRRRRRSPKASRPSARTSRRSLASTCRARRSTTSSPTTTGACWDRSPTLPSALVANPWSYFFCAYAVLCRHWKASEGYRAWKKDRLLGRRIKKVICREETEGTITSYRELVRTSGCLAVLCPALRRC